MYSGVLVKVYRMDIARNVCVRESYSEITSLPNQQKMKTAIPSITSFKDAAAAVDVNLKIQMRINQSIKANIEVAFQMCV